MIRHISFPSIEQFRSVVASVNRHYNYIGQDENNKPIYDMTLPKPCLTFTGTIKLHGTNASISYNSDDGLWVQSRENIITPQSDNAGFAMHVEKHKTSFRELIAQVVATHNVDIKENTISIYGE